MTPEKFSARVIGNFKRNKGYISYLDCVLDVCKELNINFDEYERIKSLLTPTLKKKIEVDCSERKLLKYSSGKNLSSLFE